MRRSPIALALALVTTAACARGAVIESEPGPVYSITVENPMSHAMDVWYDDGVQTSELGRVEPGSSREFIIAAPAARSVEIQARDDGRTHTITRRTELGTGSGRVVLTP